MFKYGKYTIALLRQKWSKERKREEREIQGNNSTNVKFWFPEKSRESYNK